jgi:Domain of unknown function (DUF4190)
MDAPKWPEAESPSAHPLDTFQPGVPARDSPMALASLATGILCWVVLPFVGAVVAVVTGISARREIRASGGTVGGWNMATVGLWLGAIHLFLFALAVLVVVGILVAGVGFAWFNH